MAEKKKGINPASVLSDTELLSILQEFKASHQSSMISSLSSSSLPSSPPPPPRRDLFADYKRNTRTGFVLGKLEFTTIRDGSPATVCCEHGEHMEGLIPDDLDQIQEMKCGEDVLFILLAEDKHNDTFHHLWSTNFWIRFPCIIIGTRARPSPAVSLFLKKLHTDFNLPVLAVTDCVPNAFRILAFYGSDDMHGRSYKYNLATPQIQWLGLTPYDVEEHEITLRNRHHLSKKDISTCKALLKHPCIRKRPEWVAELTKMLDDCHKSEFLALIANKGDNRYVGQVFLPFKLEQLDWE